MLHNTVDTSDLAVTKDFNATYTVDTSDLAVTKDFNALKTEVDKLDINNFANVPT